MLGWFKTGDKIGNLIAGDVIHLDPNKLPNLKIISKEEADKIAEAFPARQFIITEIK